MEEIRKSGGLAMEELEEHTVELLPVREEMTGLNLFSKNFAAAAAINGSAAAANAGNVFVFVAD